MSLYVEWLNRIKAKATYDWLTDGQRKAFDSIVGRWHSAPFICLCGPPGCGKTFIARLLTAEHGYTYAHDLNAVEPGSQEVILDDAEYTRLMIPTAKLKHLGRITLVTSTAPRDPMPIAEVVLTEHDLKQFQHNLIKYGILQSFRLHAEGYDLGAILRAEAVERGTNHVA